MGDPWLRTFLAGMATTLALLSVAGGVAALVSGQAQPAADLLAGRAGSVRSRGWRAVILGAVWAAVVVLAAVFERPLWSQLGFYGALMVCALVRGAYDRHHHHHHHRGGPGPLPRGAPRTSSDPTQLQQTPPHEQRADESGRPG